MEQRKKEILAAQVIKLEQVLKVLEDNFDIEREIPDEYSFLDTVRGNLKDLISEGVNNSDEAI